MSAKVSATIGMIGAAVTSLLGGWDYGMQLLVIAMAVDYISGVMVAGVWHKSTKTESGKLESRAGFKGLCRKGMILGLVLVAHYMDLAIGTQYIRDAIVIGFAANEIFSILENLGLMGIQYPPVIKNALEVLRKKGEEPNDN